MSSKLAEENRGYACLKVIIMQIWPPPPFAFCKSKIKKFDSDSDFGYHR